MKKLMACTILIFSIHSNGIALQDWRAIISSKAPTIAQSTYNLLTQQIQSFEQENSPKIAVPVIKSIEIIESHEELVDILYANSARISMLPNPEKPFENPNKNSGFPSASKMRKSVYEKLRAMIQHIDSLAPHFGYEAGTIDIKVFEALRDLQTQTTIFENKLREIRAAQPALTDEQAYTETCKWVSPVRDNVPVHSTGAAVDIRLWDSKKQQFIDMGMFGVIWGTNTTAPTFSTELTVEQKKNRLFMLAAAAQAGLVNYSYEWWHFSAGDRYASYWLDQKNARKAIYGAVQ